MGKKKFGEKLQILDEKRHGASIGLAVEWGNSFGGQQISSQKAEREGRLAGRANFLEKEWENVISKGK